MRSKHPPILAVVAGLIIVLVAAVLVSGCGGSDGTTTTAGPDTTGAVTTASSAAGGGAQVVMKGTKFSPAEITIKAGESVTWTNEDSVTHTVDADNGEFKSGNLAQGDTFTFTFSTPGTYPYHCIPHPFMTATIIVE